MPPTHFDPSKEKRLDIFDYPFLEQRIEWCQSNAKQLTKLSDTQWRPREVEMAVFTAQRMDLKLPPIGFSSALELSIDIPAVESREWWDGAREHH